MLKNCVIADPSNIANTIATYNHLNSNIVSNPYIPDMSDMLGFDKISNSFIIADIPTIFTITSAEICGPKLVRIKYKVEDPQLNVLSKSGNIYINSGIFGVYDELIFIGEMKLQLKLNLKNVLIKFNQEWNLLMQLNGKRN